MSTRPTRQQVAEYVKRYAFIPLFNPDDLEVTKAVLTAAYEGGVRLFEMTNRSPQALTIFKQMVPFAKQNLPDLLLGAGTILDEKTAADFVDAGASYIISPIIASEVASYCERNQVYWIPGAATLTEVVQAHQLGADMVKLFPANYLGGPGFVQAIKAPCPWLRLMPTGGVDTSEENLRAWFKVGVQCVGIGSLLFKKELLAKKDYATLRTHVQQVVDIINRIQSENNEGVV